MRKLFIVLLFLPLSALLFSSCKKNKNTDCGCDAPTRATIPDSANLIGKIYYSSQTVPNGYIFANKFFIEYREINCGNCVHYMTICNENILPSQILFLKNDNSQSLSVKFGGYLKPFCDKLIAPADYTYENIILTKIEVQ